MKSCPHCGKRVQFWSLLGLGKWRPYQCPKCHGYSHISLAIRFASYAFVVIPVLVASAIFYNLSDLHSSHARIVTIGAAVVVAMSLQALFLGTTGDFRALPKK